MNNTTTTPAGDIVVRTVGLTKVFRDFWLREKVTAVRDLDLEVHAGEIIGLLGPNGSGKSTTIKIILGLMRPTRGRVTVLGKSPSDVAIKSRIGFLPEESYLYPFLDAHETLDYYGRLFGQPRHQRRMRIEMLLEMVGLTGAAYRRIGEYSKGMQRRIGLAQALINDPDLLILDEPTSGMDPLAARQFKDLIEELSRRGKTVILSSHLLADMEDLCDRVAILYAGQLRSVGTLSDLLSRQSLSQIVTEHLDEDALAHVQQALADTGRQVLAVEAPRDKLEALFLRIIHQAQAQGRLQTAGATETGALAEFLRAQPEEQGRQVIADLVAAGAPRPVAAGAQEAAVAAAPQPAAEVLESLARPAEPPESESAPPPAQPGPKPAEPADRGVIDDLLKKKE